MCGVSLDVRKLTNETISDYRILFGNGNIKNITYNIPLLDEYLNVMNNSKQTAVIEVKDKHLSKNGAEKTLLRFTDPQFRHLAEKLVYPVLVHFRETFGRLDGGVAGQDAAGVLVDVESHVEHLHLAA